MKKIYLLFAMLSVLVPGFSQVVISNVSTVYGEDFNSLASTGTASNTPAGWSFLETGTNANNTYVADNGGVNSGNTYSYGATNSTERAFGTLLSGSLTSTLGVGFVNNSGATINSVTLTYVGEQWRLGATGRRDSLDFQYSTSATDLATGTWTNVDQLDFVGPVTTGTVGMLDGNASANRLQRTFTISGLSIGNGATFYFRWNDANATGADDGLAIDDVTVSFNGSTLPPCVAPATQPTGLAFSGLTNTTITGTFTATSPAADRYLIVISANSTLSQLPQNGTNYNDDDALGNGSIVATSATNNFTASSLTPGTTYYFYVFALSSNCSGGPVYNVQAPLTGSVATTTPPACTAPGASPGTITTTAAGTSVNGSFADATGADGYLAIRSSSAAFTFTPVNGTAYTLGQTVGSGTTGTVIKFSDGNTFSATGLTPNTTYYFYVYSVRNFSCVGGPLYNVTPTAATATTTNNSTGEPAGYYLSANGKSCADLKTTLKTIVTTGHTPRTYNELWAQYQVSDFKPREVGPGTSSTVIWDVYSDNPTGADPYNFTPGTGTGGQQDNGTGGDNEGEKYNREHSVPLNWFAGSTGVVGAATDYFHLFPTDKLVNNQRSSYIYGEVAAPTFTSLNGSKLGSSAIAGFSGPVFEPINEYKGDLARAFLYFVTRYEESMPGWPGGLNGTQAFDPTTYPSVDVPYLRLMMKWHQQDPVSPKEIDRNNAGYSYQGNRNPYIDHPEYVSLTWNSNCPGLSALPVNIVSFGGRLQGELIRLEWLAMNEQNFDRYEVERSVNGITYTKIGEVKAANLGDYSFTDNADVLRGKRIYYRLRKVDKDGTGTYSAVFSIHIPLNTRFSIYPNPAGSFMQLQMNRNVNGKVVVMIADLSGRTLKQQTVQANGSTISLSTAGLGNGTYAVKISYLGEEYTQKLVVAK